MTNRSVGIVAMAAAAGIVFVTDQLTKAWATANISSHEVRPVIEGFLRLRYTENTGAAFGLFQGWTGALSILAVAVVLAIVASAQRVGNGSRLSMLALGLVTGGALGNLADRVRLGYVVDFIEAHGLRANFNNTIYTFPVFNVADSAISVGVVLLVVTLFFGGKADEPMPHPRQQDVQDKKLSPWRINSHQALPVHTEEPKATESPQS
ncbi:MAG TPA: signal peptidase II [Chloroflexia bacterium]|nr:signal peptidase II [Chloroflexia bacterium]